MLTIFFSIAPLLIASLFVAGAQAFLNTLLSLRLGQAGLPSDTVGLIMGLYPAGLCIGVVYLHGLVSKIGHIRSFAAFAAAFSISALMHGYGYNLFFWGGLRFIQGMSYAGLLLCLESWLNTRASDRTRGAVLSLYMLFCYIGIAGGQLAVALPDPSGIHAFVTIGICLALSLMPVVVTKIPQPELPAPTRLSPLRLLKLAPLGLSTCLASGLIGGAFYALAPLTLQKMTFSNTDVGQLMGWAVFGGFIAQWPIGYLSDRFDRRMLISILCTVAALLSLSFSAISAPPFAGMALLLFLFGCVIFSLYPLSVSHANDLLPPQKQVRMSASLVLMYGIGSVIGPLLAGIGVSYIGTTGLFIWVAGVGLVMFVLSFYRFQVADPIPDDVKAPFVSLRPQTTHIAGVLDPRDDPNLTIAALNEDDGNDVPGHIAL